jgi:hypothetical protein
MKMQQVKYELFFVKFWQSRQNIALHIASHKPHISFPTTVKSEVYNTDWHEASKLLYQKGQEDAFVREILSLLYWKPEENT